ncbi:hypothetical protein L1887_04515 [Cichorium endivia]|nr:hypothetical protein L1887_04515 [Cichorium endivia]
MWIFPSRLDTVGYTSQRWLNQIEGNKSLSIQFNTTSSPFSVSSFDRDTQTQVARASTPPAKTVVTKATTLRFHHQASSKSGVSNQIRFLTEAGGLRWPTSSSLYFVVSFPEFYQKPRDSLHSF